MQLFRLAFAAMGSPNALQLWADDEPAARKAAGVAIADVARLEAKYSRYRDDSVVTAINRAAGAAPVAIDGETAALLRYADRCHALSQGRFDVTSGALSRAWDFRRTPARLPDPAALAAARSLIGWRDVEWGDRSIRLPRAGMQIDFGGIVKEYAADRAATLLAECGVAHGLVNLGGDVRVLGPHPDGSPWRVGIADPRPPAHAPDAAIAGIDVAEGAVATSGDYERYFEVDGQRYCHIVNARTGLPVRHWRSVSVVAPLCVIAGSCATIATLLEAGAARFLAGQRCRWLAVDGEGRLHGDAAAAGPVTDRPSPERRTRSG